MRDPGALDVEIDERGLYLPGLGLWLDPVRAAPCAFVSHAHASKSAEGSGRVLASPETLAIARALGAGGARASSTGPLLASELVGDDAGLRWDERRELPVDRARGGGVALVSLAPAGHMLGAAQLVIEHGGRRLVYTGDWSGEADATRGAGAIVPCDELIVTAAFGLPIFRFAPAAHVLQDLVAWCASRLTDGVTPVVLGRSPGLAQVVTHALSARGLPVSGDEEVRRGCAAYEALGVALGPVPAHEPGAKGRAVVASPSTKASVLRPRGRFEVAYASPWAILDAAVEQRRADAAFVLTDQAEFDGLRALVQGSGARRVVATRGDVRVFARLLRTETGVEVRALELPAIDERSDS